MVKLPLFDHENVLLYVGHVEYTIPILCLENREYAIRSPFDHHTLRGFPLCEAEPFFALPAEPRGTKRSKSSEDDIISSMVL